VVASVENLVGQGLQVDQEVSHPAGVLFSGGYDPEANELFLASVMGHPGGVAAAGGTPSVEQVSGLRVLVVKSGDVYWANDSMSLPRGLNNQEADAVHTGLKAHFVATTVRRVAKLEDIPR
jgi:hypothetical protein